MTFPTSDHLRLEVEHPTSGWANIIGPTIELTVERTALDLGTLSGVVRDVQLDPSSNALIRKGNRIRLSARVGETTAYEPLFTGEIRNARVTYDLKDPEIPASKRAKIEVSATDGVSTLANAKRAEGVATVAELPYVLAGLALPMVANGSSAPVASATIVSRNENSTALDQVLITRDSQLGEAWVGRDGTLYVYDAAHVPSTSVATLDETAYSEFGLDYDESRCINTVTLRLLRFNIATGETVEVLHGPYVDEDSVAQWGSQSAEYTVQGISETDDGAALAALASQILAANANPTLRANTVTLPIQTPAQVSTSRALLDLGQIVTVVNDDAGITQPSRIDNITHRITGGKWLMDLTFVGPDSVATPVNTPSVGGVYQDPDLQPGEDGDGVPPPAPSRPTVAARLGVVSIEWDGLDNTGQPMPDDLQHVEAVLDETTDRVVGYLVGKGDTAYVTDAPYNVPVTAYLVAVDTEGLRSAPSLTASATPTPLVPQDLDEQITDAIETAQTTADGKNRVTYSTSAPGTTANKAGDIWFQTSGALIVAQYRGNGGTSWTAMTLENAVLATLDAGKITTGLLAAARIASLSITTDKLAANAVTADKVNAGAITAIKLDAEAIDGKTITGATVRTAAAGERMVMRNDGSGGVLESFSGVSSSELAGAVNPDSNITGSAVARMNVYPGRLSSQRRPLLTMGASSVAGPTSLFGWETVGGDVDLYSATTRLTANSIFLDGATTIASVVLGSSAAPNLVRSPSVAATNIATGTTPNMWIHPTNDIMGRIGSARALKLNIEDLAPAEARNVLDLRARTFYDRNSCETRAAYLAGESETDALETVARRLGLVAEEVHDAGFGELVQYDDQGVPVSVNYDRVGVALIPVVRELRDENDALRERVAALETAVAALTSMIGDQS